MSCGIRNFLDEDTGGEKVSVDTEASGGRSVPELPTGIPTLSEISAKQPRPFLRLLGLVAQPGFSFEQLDQRFEEEAGFFLSGLEQRHKVEKTSVLVGGSGTRTLH